MTNQEFLALAVMESDLQKVKNVLEAYENLFGEGKSWQIVTETFLYDINPSTMLISINDNTVLERYFRPFFQFAMKEV